MPRIGTSIIIERPIAQVFEYVCVVAENGPKWRKSCAEIRRLGPGPLAAGMREIYKLKTFGRTFDVLMEITEYEPNRKYSWRAISGGPFPMHGAITFESVEGGTRVAEDNEITLTGFLRLIQPFIVQMYRREVEADFAKLKHLLESGGEDGVR